jgi:hypothetical protein
MGKNENLLIASSHFWSDALNAFMFGNGLIAPTLLDVVMLTGLDISEDDRPFYHYHQTNSSASDQERGWWKGYIAEHARTGTIESKEHTSFLNMWLEKFIFYGSTCGPTTNMQAIAERLAIGNIVPLG